DNFFELGGNSLQAIQILARVRSIFGVAMPVEVLFESPTVASIAAAVDEAPPEEEDDGPDPGFGFDLAEDGRSAATESAWRDRLRRLLPDDGATVLELEPAAELAEPPGASVDAVVAVSALAGVPRDAALAVLGRAARWLRSDGLLLAALDTTAGGQDDADAWFDDVALWGDSSGDESRELLREAGFAPVRDEVVGATFWALARPRAAHPETEEESR
ncbi:MAG TPA: phosphopantetheine-binding protein, partial [Candidatus Dormibacteraeota bacterium]